LRSTLSKLKSTPPRLSLIPSPANTFVGGPTSIQMQHRI
jgi:hypothetical protein